MVKVNKHSYLAKGDFVYRHSPAPVFVKATGVVMEDKNGKRYFCAEAANGTTGLGFDSSIIDESFIKIKDIPSIPSFCETEIRLKLAVRLGKKISEITGIEGHLAFELGGAQGIELALRIAKANNSKSQYAVFEGGYHGRSIFTAQLSASHRYRSAMGDWRIPVIRLPYPDYEQSGKVMSKKIWQQNYLKQLDLLASRETGGMIAKGKEKDVVALIVEPVLNAGGITKPDKEILEKVVETFRRLGAIIIVDEVFCGFYRTGPMFGFQHYSFTPDIIVMSKAITNGITPLSCVWAKDPLLIAKNFPPGSHSATFVNQPFGLAVADTVLDRYEKWSTLNTDIKYIESRLDGIIQRILKISKHTVSGNTIGALGRILLKHNNAGKILDIARSVAWKNPVNGVHGLILASTGMASNVIAINPPLKMKKLDLDTLEGLLMLTFKKANTEIK
ncbi:MAG: aminotransferase class III-fold pyridoxal phosphate-dependent enzyme [Patescibacteria group bacterium]